MNNNDSKAKLQQIGRRKPSLLSSPPAEAVEQDALAKHADYFIKYANDIVLLMDRQGNIIDANDRAESAYGLAREELTELNVKALRAQDQQANFFEHLSLVQENKSAMFESRHRHVGGTDFPVEVSTRLIEVDSGVFIQSIIRDISERKEAEVRWNRRMGMYRALSGMSEAMMRLADESDQLQLACRIIVEQGDWLGAWIGSADPDGLYLVPLAHYGVVGGYIEQLIIPLPPTTEESNAPSAVCFRQVHPVVVNDFGADYRTLPWHDSARRYGIQAMMAFPILRDGMPDSILTVYSDRIGAFDDEIVALMGEVASNVSYVIERLDRERRRYQVETAMRQSEERFRRIAEESPFPMMLFAQDGEVLQFNRAWIEITGYSRTGVRTVQQWIARACVEASARTMIDGVYALMAPGDHGEVLIRCADGSLRLWQLVVTSLGQMADQRQLSVGMAIDITERKKAEEALVLADKMFEHSYGSIVITDVDANIIRVNPAFTRISGYSREDVVGQNPRILKSGRHNPEFYLAFWEKLTQTGRWQGEIWNKRKNGEEYVERLSVSAIRDEAGKITHYIGLADDITESEANKSRIEFLSYHDALTGLPNRALAGDRLDQAIVHAHRERVAVIFIDLDDFKSINDTAGHAAGDQLIQAVAERLKACVPEHDTVGRQGDDEFIVLLTEVDELDDVNKLLVGIQEQIARPYRVGNMELSVTGSIGVAIYPEDGRDSVTLMQKADMAMNSAKQSGRNMHRFFTEEMNSYMLEHLLIRSSMQRALTRSEFMLHYQPLLDLAENRVIGAEALMRWEHPDLGMIKPGRFIQVAEESGMIIPIGSWVLREACRQAMSWQASGYADLLIAVNISALQFQRGDLEHEVKSALKESGLPPHCLELELTESILIQDAEQSLETINRLKEMGVRLSIDDFGTGYSSLAYLRRLPVDKLKIDRSFVTDITERQDDAAIALSIIMLAHTLQKTAIAEGVETREQYDFLKSQGCDQIQGYYYSPPLPAGKFAEFLESDQQKHKK